MGTFLDTGWRCRAVAAESGSFAVRSGVTSGVHLFDRAAAMYSWMAAEPVVSEDFSSRAYAGRCQCPFQTSVIPGAGIQVMGRTRDRRGCSGW
jgi:hypothetical protein